MKRPIAVTIIAFLIIASGILSLVMFPAMLAAPQKIMSLVHSRIPFAAQMILSAVGTVLMLAAGVGLLIGANWARYLYIVWGGLGLVQLLVLFQFGPQQIFGLVIGCVKYAIFVYFLTRHDANAYFRDLAQA